MNAEDLINEQIYKALKNRGIDIIFYEDLSKGVYVVIDTYKHDKQIRADAIEFISDKIIYPLLDEYDIGLWEHIDYIPLAEKWVETIRNNPSPKVKNCDEARKKYLKKWIAELLKENL